MKSEGYTNRMHLAATILIEDDRSNEDDVYDFIDTVQEAGLPKTSSELYEKYKAHIAARKA